MSQSQVPSPSANNGRRPDGKFGPGNRAGRGNPHAKRAQKLRSAVLYAVKPNDIKQVIEKLVELAKDGDINAAKLLFDRALGKPSATTAATDEAAAALDAESDGTIKERALTVLRMGDESDAG